MGDLGRMHPVGTHINTIGHMCQYVTSCIPDHLPILRATVTACSRLATGITVPGVLCVAKDLEDDAGVDGNGLLGMMHTVLICVNVSISYNVNDAYQGFSFLD